MDHEEGKRKSTDHQTDNNEVPADLQDDVVEHDAELPEAAEVPDPARNEYQLNPPRTNSNCNKSPEEFPSLNPVLIRPFVLKFLLFK